MAPAAKWASWADVLPMISERLPVFGDEILEAMTGESVLSLRTRTECVAHVLEALTEANPDATVLSIDGVSAFDMVSRRVMLAALHRVLGGDQILPFVRLLYKSLSRYLWEDDEGVVHHILQGEGEESGYPLMPLFFTLGIHDASGVEARGCQTLQRTAAASGSREQVWKGSGLPTDQQGIQVLGTLLGHTDFVIAHLVRVLNDHRTLLKRITVVQDVQCAWALLLPQRSWQGPLPSSSREILLVLSAAGFLARDTASLPVALGEMGLRSASRSRQSACQGQLGGHPFHGQLEQ